LLALWFEDAQHCSHGCVRGGSEEKCAQKCENGTPVQVTNGVISERLEETDFRDWLANPSTPQQEALTLDEHCP
jgi:hypothetical protein